MELQGGSASRMMRELVILLENIAIEKPLLLIIEDLHWADDQTLAALLQVITSVDHASLFIIATYRHLEQIESRFLETFTELLAKQKCTEIVLNHFTNKNIRSYLRASNCCNDNVESISEWLYRNTKGLPLFVTSLYKYAILQGWLHQEGQELERLFINGHARLVVPGTLRSLINSQINQLPGYLQMFLEIASVYGMMISTNYLKKHLFGKDYDPEHCAEILTKGFGFLKRVDDVSLHHGKLNADFAFAHPWYQKVAYERLSPKMRADIHEIAGSQLENMFQHNVDDIASVLALHYEKSGNLKKAIFYRKQAAQVALVNYTPDEAERQLNRGFKLIKMFKYEQLGHVEEIEMLMMFGSILVGRKGYAHSKVEKVYSRAHELCLKYEKNPHVLPALFDLCMYYINRREFETCKDLLNMLFELSQGDDYKHFIPREYTVKCMLCWYQGKYPDSLDFAKQSLEYSNHLSQRVNGDILSVDTRLTSVMYHSLALWIMGYPEQAQRQMNKAIEITKTHENPFMKAWGFCFAGWLESFLRNYSSAEDYGRFCLEETRKNDIQYWNIQASILREWAQIMSGKHSGSIDYITTYFDAHQEIGISLSESMLLFFLAEGLSQHGYIELALAQLDNVLGTVDRFGDMWWKAEILRLRADLLVKQSLINKIDVDIVYHEAEHQYHQAINLAKRQSAKSLELRAATSLFKLLDQVGKKEQGRILLGDVYHSFNEGFKTYDLLKAQKLIMDNA
ncbi:ATP-binding protein [Desulfofustis limnaeus]|uniref:Orc1-like AAA ATPase domain-containing protein n=1 Tax=Desulfofustis limnaeus TaxID=2740163 RepID=A0ABM7WAM7_9BACT|nr:hypothetical protein [Desulfofustis limnaeus]BDD87953.1 hypothetical protein DPPLL_23180 [Desulfofustis limnaeus]